MAARAIAMRRCTASLRFGAASAARARPTCAPWSRTLSDDAAVSASAAAEAPQRRMRLLDPTLDTSGMSEPVRRVFELANASNADVTAAQAETVAAAFRTHDADCGSTRVQIARLSVHIDALREHMNAHPKDYHSKRGVMAKISKRARLLKYLKRENPADHAKVLAALDLKDVKRR